MQSLETKSSRPRRQKTGLETRLETETQSLLLAKEVSRRSFSGKSLQSAGQPKLASLSQPGNGWYAIFKLVTISSILGLPAPRSPGNCNAVLK